MTKSSTAMGNIDVLHYMVTVLRERIFRTSRPDGVVMDIMSAVDQNLTAIAKGDVNVVATVLRNWLQELSNSLIPIELLDLVQETPPHVPDQVLP
jgi:hypothetical protein